MTVRTAALVTFITSALSLIPVLRNNVVKVESVSRSWFLPLVAVLILQSAILPAFYFALYRNETSLRFSRGLRLVALAAAVALGIRVGAGMPAWIAAFGENGARSVLAPTRGLPTARDVFGLLGELSNAACILLMVVLYRQRNSASETVIPVSKLLGIVTRAALVVWGVWMVFNLGRLALLPYYYAALRISALQLGATPPPLRELVRETVGTVVSAAGVLAAPYIVWRASASALNRR